MRLLVSLISGLLFGIGLTISDMINPARVTGFLDLAGAWDPSAAFVFAGALTFSGLAFFLAKRRSAPLLDDRFHFTAKARIDRPLVIGSILFGLGWGLSGFCPGPVLAALTSFQGNVAIFALAMFAGMAIFRFLPARNVVKDDN